ncbi:MAG: hypothetical protein HY652_07635 [Acidobacteria bacterium]|nr:hypothetical protein [Acidobacteriota bacterium]
MGLEVHEAPLLGRTQERVLERGMVVLNSVETSKRIRVIASFLANLQRSCAGIRPPIPKTGR